MNFYTIIFKDGSKELFPMMLSPKEAEELIKNGLDLVINVHFGYHSPYELHMT